MIEASHPLERESRPFGQDLNAAQLEAATFGTLAPENDAARGVAAGPLLVIAGAGTGKTNTLAHRVAFLLLHRVAPERIVLLTFTRRAAQEMLQRAERITQRSLRDAPRSAAFHPNATRMMWSGTFHSIGNRLLREYAHVLGLDSAFSVIDRGDAADLIDLQRQALGLAKQSKALPAQGHVPRDLFPSRQHARHPCADVGSELSVVCRVARRAHAAVSRVRQAKQQQRLLDYDDLLLYWHLLAQEPAVARELGERFEHVLVDEYQDTNTLQARNPARDEAGRRRAVRRRRRCAGDLFVPRRRRGEHPRVSDALLACRRGSSRWTRTTDRCSRSSMRRTH